MVGDRCSKIILIEFPRESIPIDQAPKRRKESTQRVRHAIDVPYDRQIAGERIVTDLNRIGAEISPALEMREWYRRFDYVKWPTLRFRSEPVENADADALPRPFHVPGVRFVDRDLL